MPPGKLEGRIALVTGGLRGIGRGIVEALTEAGAVTVIADLDPEDGSEVRDALSRSSGTTYRRLDVSSEEEWAAAASAIEADHGHLDVLVNNAGRELTGPVESIQLSDWRRLMSVNLDGAFLGTRTFRSLLIKGGQNRPAGASIVNISSVLGINGMSGQAAYSASKGGVRLFTKSCAVEFADAGLPIRVNSLHPGGVETPLFERGLRQQAAATGIDIAVLREQAMLAAPMRRVAQPIEIGRAVAFLASDDASYMTGSELVVDGGWSAR